MTFIATCVIIKPVYNISLRNTLKSNTRDSEFSATSAHMGLKTKRILLNTSIIFITDNAFLVTSVIIRPEIKLN